MHEKVIETDGIVHISTNVSRRCPHCEKYLPASQFEDAVNHLVRDHRYQLLHVGPEVAWDDNHKAVHHTVAVLAAPKVKGGGFFA